MDADLFRAHLLRILEAGSIDDEAQEFLDSLTETGPGDPGEIYVNTSDGDSFVVKVEAM